MIAGPVLSPCSFHSSWSCAALRQGHPASTDQLTDQEQCEAAKRITTRAKILSIDGPKTKRQKRSVFPRVRMPCGHGAQVIIEGKEIQSDGGEKDTDNPTTNQNKQPKPTGRDSTIK